MAEEIPHQGVKEWIEAAAETAAPYAKVVSGLASVYSAIETTKWQNATTDQLNAISRQLTELNQKVTNITNILVALPGEIKQLITQRHLDDISESISGYQTLINAYTARPPGSPFPETAKQHLANIADTVGALSGLFDAAIDDPRGVDAQGYAVSAYYLVAGAITAFIGAASAAEEQYDRVAMNNLVSSRIAWFKKASNILNVLMSSYNDTANAQQNYVDHYPELLLLGTGRISADWGTVFPKYPDNRQILHDGETPPIYTVVLVYLSWPRARFNLNMPCTMDDYILSNLVIHKLERGYTNNLNLNPLNGQFQPDFLMQNYGVTSVRDRAYTLSLNFQRARYIYGESKTAANAASAHIAAIEGPDGIIAALRKWLN